MSTTPAFDPLTDLPSQVITVYTQLVTFTDPATVDDIAHAASTPRSSTFKALVTLEKRGLATRERGIQNGPHRRPDHWQTTHNTTPTKTSNTQSATPTEAKADPSTPAKTPTPEIAPPTETSDATAPDKPTTIEKEPETSTDKRDETITPEEPSTHESPAPATVLPAPHTADEANVPATQPVIAVPGGGKRLAPGHLRQLVLDHLNTHHGEAFTATRVSRIIDRSSGAIANALATLTAQGLAEQVTEHPRTYRATTPKHTA